MVRRKSNEPAKKNATGPSTSTTQRETVIEKQQQTREKQPLAKKQMSTQKTDVNESDNDGDDLSSTVSSVSSVSSEDESSDTQSTKAKPKRKTPPQPETRVLSSTRNDLATTTTIVNKRKSAVPKKRARVFGEIRRLQNTTNNLIPRAPFLRVVKELIINRCGRDMRITEMAVEALREASECILTSVFEDSYLLSIHAKRVTLMAKDMQLLLRLKHQDFYPIK